METASASPAAREAARTAAAILLETGAAFANVDEPFTFTSGRRSPIYVDCRKLISYPRARAKLMELACELIGREIGYESLDAVAGGETAGIPFAAWIADRLALPMLYVRKQAKGFGRMAQIEGDLKPKSRVLLVEDLATDAGSKINFVNALRTAEAEVRDTIVIYHYAIVPTSVVRLREIGVRLHALATAHDLIEMAEERGYFPPPVAAEVRRFLADPDAWAKERFGA